MTAAQVCTASQDSAAPKAEEAAAAESLAILLDRRSSVDSH